MAMRPACICYVILGLLRRQTLDIREELVIKQIVGRRIHHF